MERTKATGAAFILDDTCVLMGETPSEPQVRMLAETLSKREQTDIFVSDHLAGEFPAAEAFTETASGMLAISLSQVHRFQILWFRPEILRTVNWAGEPQVEAHANGRMEISPRRSFASWSELVRRHSEPWTSVEIEAARDFRNAVLSIVLRRAEELADMAAELEFTNKELEAFSYSVSHDLRAPFRHISGFAELLLSDESDRLTDRGKGYLNRISQAAQFAGQLVDSLLNFSQIARTKLDMRPIPMDELVREVWEDVTAEELHERAVEFHCDELPMVEGDAQLLRQAWRNLLSNAAKYTSKRDGARVQVGATRDHHQFIFSVSDNGVGFDNRYAHKLFGAFQRLHRVEEFEGTGIGLANVRRIITRHGGQTWAEGKLNEGATFYFSLPVPEGTKSHS
jgi:light-regulated signal transduction histidine kinase (bacteriophytochrome)